MADDPPASPPTPSSSPPTSASRPDPSTPDQKPSDPLSSFDSDRPSRVFCCYFSPILGTQQEYEDFFHSEKCDTYTEIIIRPKEGWIRFATRAEADLFLEHFHGITFKGQRMRVEKSRPSAQPCRTVHLSGFTPERLTERAIYKKMLEFGFIRRVALKKDYAFVDYDTVEEASSAVRHGRSVEIAGEAVRVAFARSEHKMETRLAIPLKYLVPLNHPFWYELQERLYDAGPHFQ
jgi:hypothetical protein